jgi:hypothetical protein
MKNIFLFIPQIIQSTFNFKERGKFFGLLALLFFTIDHVAYSQCAPTIAYTASIQQFTVPAGVTSISVEAWGGGGKGGKRDNDNGGTGGGGAGAYSSSSLPVTPGEILYFKTGTGSTSSSDPGEDSWISRNANGSTPLVLAKGGSSVLGDNNPSGATGGLATESIGTIKTNGQDGEDGISSGNPSDFSGGAGGDSPNGGNGGPRVTSGNTAGNSGEFPGGGGSGAKTSSNNITRDGGSGGNGLVKIEYDCASSNPSGCWRYIDDGSVSGTVIIEFFENCTWEAPEGLLEFEVLVVGGGGGGGANAGGGGGAGGLIHARADVSELETYGLPANSLFEITVGDGGTGSDDEDERGADGIETSFDNGGIYEVIASGGGGGGSADNERGRNGKNSTYRNSTTGFSIVEVRNFGSSGGGAGEDGKNMDRGQGGENGKRGGRGRANAGGGGGGVNDDGNNADDGEGGDGGAGITVSEFDARIYAAGGGGGAQDERGLGGENKRGGNGGEDDDENGEDGQTPGSGGGGSGDNNRLRGGNGAKGVVIVRYEIAKILPIEYLYFNSNYNSQARTGELSWATAKEWENSHFEIERAVNNVKEWEAIGEVAGAGFSDSEVKYNYSDIKLPVGGGNIFYRLKQYDFNGKFTYSNTKSIKVEPLPSTSKWKVFPNPTTGDSFNIEILDPSTYRDESLTLRVIAPTGQFELIQKDQMQEMSTQVSNYFEGKASGVYTIEIAWGANREYHKVILRR